MEENKLNRLKEILSVPSYSRDETRMISYLTNMLVEKGYEYTLDSQGNIFITKGNTEFFPLFVAHTDTVHSINLNLTIKEYIDETHGGKVALTGFDNKTNLPSGCGGDDKCGVFLALEMLDILPNVKVALFVSEEIGCLGSKGAVKTNPDFFKNVGYAIQYDSPEGDTLSSTLMGKYLFESSPEFTQKVTGLIVESGITKWANHPYTDIWPLIETFDFCCLNLAAGYYKMHSPYEYVIVDDVQKSFELGLKLVEQLGENKYVLPKKQLTYTNNYKPKRKERSSLLLETEEDKRMIKLYDKPVTSWSDEDWDFYDDYCEKNDGGICYY